MHAHRPRAPCNRLRRYSRRGVSQFYLDTRRYQIPCGCGVAGLRPSVRIRSPFAEEIIHRRSQRSQREGPEKPLCITCVLHREICAVLGGIEDLCRDRSPRIDQCRLFEIFAAFCADSLRGFARSGDDRERRIHSQKVAKVSKKGSGKAGFYYPRDSSRHLSDQAGRHSGLLS
jgi:hypothetical protein